MVTATLTERQLRIHELSFREDLSGQELAKRLGVTAEQAARLKNETRNLLMNGIGALVLAQSGRAFCPILAEILDDAQWDGENFSARLRQRIVRHFDTCPTCDNCSTCAAKQQELGKQLIPVLIPMLFAEMLHARIRDAIRQSASWAPDRPGRPESGPPAPPPAVSRPRSRRPGGPRTGSPGNGRASRSGKRPPGRARRLSRGSSPGLIRAIAIIAGAAIAAGIAIPLIIHHPSRSGARAAVAAADVVAVHACSAQSAGQVHIPSAPRFTRLPAPVRLPEQAQVFGGIPDIGEKSSNVIAPSDMTSRLDVGGADSGGYVYLSKGGSPDISIEEILSPGGGPITYSIVCSYLPQAAAANPSIGAGASTGCQQAQPGDTITEIPTSTPTFYVSEVRVPAGASDPYVQSSGHGYASYAVFATQIVHGQVAQFLEMDYALPVSQGNICRTGLIYFAASFFGGTGMTESHLAKLEQDIGRLIK